MVNAMVISILLSLHSRREVRSPNRCYNLGREGQIGFACRAILTPACDEVLLVSKRGLKTPPGGNREICRKIIKNIQELLPVNLWAIVALHLETPNIQIFPSFCYIQCVCLVLLWSVTSGAFCTSDLCFKWRKWCFSSGILSPASFQFIVFPVCWGREGSDEKTMERRCSDIDSSGERASKQERGSSDGKEI